MFSQIVLVFLLVVAVCNAFTLQSSAARQSRMSLSMARKPLMGGNWKLNPTNMADSYKLANELVAAIGTKTSVDVAIFPPTAFLFPIGSLIKDSNVALGGQNCYHMDSGAYTGATSTCMLTDLGVTYVLCGHSERRTIFNDNDKSIALKVNKVLDAGMKPVLCIGESKDEYDAGLNHEVCAIQIMKDLANVSAEQMKNVVLAYEPVWAIGTGLVCPADVAQEVHSFIRGTLAKKYGQAVADEVVIQYGGSVNAGNVKEIMAMPDIDGCLVGGASLKADSFASIINFDL